MGRTTSVLESVVSVPGATSGFDALATPRLCVGGDRLRVHSLSVAHLLPQSARIRLRPQNYKS